MATILKIKRSTGTAAPTAVGTGELAYNYGTGTSGNLGDRLFVGTGTETAGVAANIDVIGGKYFADMLNHTPGTLTGNSALIVDGSSKIDILNVDNLTLNGNTVSSTDTNGNVNLTPHGTGKTVATNLYIGSDSIQEYIEDISGGSVTGGTGITATYDDGAGTTTLAAASVPNASLSNSSIAFTDGSTSSSISLGGTLTISPTANETTVSQSGGTYTVGLPATVSGLTGVSATNLTGTLQTAAQTNITSLGTLTGLTFASSSTVSLNSNRITNVSDPSGAQDAATKSYVDAVINGLDVKDAVLVATTANLAATYSSNVLTSSANAALVVDGVTMAVDDRVLVKDQSTNTHNGIYDVTTIGSGSAVFVLTRSSDANTSTNISGGSFVFVESGSTNADNGFVATHNGSPTLGSDAITFTQFSEAGAISAGNALTKTGNTLDVTVDDSSIEVSSSSLSVKALGITNAMLAGSVDLAAKVTGTLPVANGGTGATSLTANRLMLSNGTSAITVLAAGTAGQVMLSNGASAPAFADIDGGTF
jgi:hypothetical protein